MTVIWVCFKHCKSVEDRQERLEANPSYFAYHTADMDAEVWTLNTFCTVRLVNSSECALFSICLNKILSTLYLLVIFLSESSSKLRRCIEGQPTTRVHTVTRQEKNCFKGDGSVFCILSLSGEL